MKSRLTDLEFCRSNPLALLRQVYVADVQALDSDIQTEWTKESEAAARRREAHRINVLLDEFKGQLKEPGEDLVYEHGFVLGWYETVKPLYNLRWWINNYVAGVYFLYGPNDELNYVGTSCGGTIGARMWLKKHRSYARSADVVLFDNHQSHFALAFEALAICRLQPPKNSPRGFKSMKITPMPPYDEIWKESTTTLHSGDGLSDS